MQANSRIARTGPLAASLLGSALWTALVCALLGGLFLWLPWGWEQEESAGLGWLYAARGAREAPPKVRVIAIDQPSSEAFSVPYDTREWPRALHARLIEALHAAGASAVVFDLLFRVPREGDERLIEALASAPNVLLLEFLEKRQVALGEGGSAKLQAAIHTRVMPYPQLRAAAMGTGPFTLPKVPIRVAQFWLFDGNAGGAPSLPILALMLHALPDYPALVAAMQGVAADLARDLPAIDEIVTGSHLAELTSRLAHAQRERPGLAQALLSQLAASSGSTVRADGSTLPALIHALGDPTQRYLNYYGPPYTIPTLSYHEALRLLEGSVNTTDWAGNVVLVGLSSPVQWQQMDAFITVFSDPLTGHDLSGIEILATAIANLIDRSNLRPLSAVSALLLVIVWGLLVGALARLVTPWWALGSLALLGGGYFVLALWLFDEQFVWIPLVTPLTLQLPLALLLSSLLHYRAAWQDKTRIRQLFRYYLPEPVVERLVREGAAHPMQDRETVYGVCLNTDAAQYTTLAEAMDPDALARMMNAYYELLFAPVRNNEGSISDVIGDAMMAIWAARHDDKAIRMNACRTALQIVDALDDAQAIGGPGLPTRMGLHCGQMTLAHVGAGDHFEYRAVGDIVNTASRLQDLNKQLNTRLLVSADVLRGIEDAFETKPHGAFLLPGKLRPIEVHELIGWSATGQQR